MTTLKIRKPRRRHPRKKGKDVGRQLRYRRATRKKYLKYIIPEGQLLQKKIIRNYWLYLTFNRDFKSRESICSFENLSRKIAGIVIIPNKKRVISRGVVEYPPFREIINSISVVENSIVETALLCKNVLVFGDIPTLHRLRNTIGQLIRFPGRSKTVKIFYIPNLFISDDMRQTIWYTFRFVNKISEQVSDITYLKYFYHFCYESINVEEYQKLIVGANPMQSIFFEAEEQSFLTGRHTPALLSALDIFKIRRMKNWDTAEFARRAYFPRKLQVDLIHDFSTKEGIVDYLRSGDTYIEDRKYRFNFKTREEEKSS